MGAVDSQTLYWHDYETFGRNPRTDRVAQFAGIRTNLNLDIVGKPYVSFCKLSDDYLPGPEACLVHGLSPQEVNRQGVCEAKFIDAINRQLGKQNTCAVGYNSIEFDDEFTRNLLYRNLFDPYAREWKHGCSRWDLINVVRLAAALRPDGIIWPRKEDGKPSFRLEDIAKANSLDFGGAHDALNDVKTTIAVAQLLRHHQLRLYNYCFANRHKGWAKQQLDVIFRRPVLHVDSSYGSKNNYLAVVVPITRHPKKDSGIIVYDLSQDPDAIISLDEDDIRERIFSKKEKLEQLGLQRIRLKTIMLNRCPVIAEYKTLRDIDAERLGLDKQICLANLETLKKVNKLGTKIRKVFSVEYGEPTADPDLMLYQGKFLSRDDRQSLQGVRRTSPEELVGCDIAFSDSRLPEMIFRYRARNFPHTLTAEEQKRWTAFRGNRLLQPNDVAFRSLHQFQETIENLKQGNLDESQQQLVNQLEKYGREITGGLHAVS